VAISGGLDFGQLYGGSPFRHYSEADIQEAIRRLNERYPKVHGHLYCGGKLIGEIISPIQYTPTPPNVQYIGPLDGKEITIEMNFGPITYPPELLEELNESTSES